MTQFTPSVKRVSKVDTKTKLKLGNSLAKQKRFEEAVKEFEEILQQDPTSAPAYSALGNIAYRQNLYSEALEYLHKAIQLDPLKLAPQLRAGRVYLKQKNLEGALEQFLNVIRIDPKSTLAHAGAGQVYLLQKKYEDAIKHFRIALQLNPQMAAIRQRLAVAYLNQGKLGNSLAELTSALRTNPNDSKLHLGVGQTYLLQKDFPSARTAFETAIKLSDDPPTAAKLGLAEALIGEKRYGEANEVLQSMPPQVSLTARHHKLWGDVYTAQGLFKEASEAYKAASISATEDVSISDFLSGDTLLEGQDEEAWEERASTYRQSAEAIVEKRRAAFLG